MEAWFVLNGLLRNWAAWLPSDAEEGNRHGLYGRSIQAVAYAPAICMIMAQTTDPIRAFHVCSPMQSVRGFLGRPQTCIIHLHKASEACL